MDCRQLVELAAEKRIRVCIDSRQVGRGDIFVAICGTATDGHNFIGQAIAQGAEYIVYNSGRMLPDIGGSGAVFVDVNDTSAVVGELAQASVGNPAAVLTSLAVTGTNGKTTTSSMVRAVLNNCGHKCGLIGTIENDTCDPRRRESAIMTTPDAVTLASLMRQMVDNGAEFMCIEASSHSLDQKRLSSVEFTAAAFTNLTGDHLDYHGTMENYVRAKARLFEQLPSRGTAILNAEDKYSDYIAQFCKVPTLRYSAKEQCKADIYAQILDIGDFGTNYLLCYNGQKNLVKSSFCGYHNISNQLAAAGLCLATGLSIEQIAAGLTAFKNVPGRLERVDAGQGFSVFVDYAHTDDALKNVFETLKPLCKGRLLTVFGCGGDRDKTKRPRMAAVARQFSDMVFVTSDNPRTEDPIAIIEDIKAGFPAGDLSGVYVEPDRKMAIGKAVESAKPGDILLIAGKGHEDYQIIGTQKHHFDDREVVREFLLNLN